MKVIWDHDDIEDYNGSKVVSQEFYPNGCETNPLCQAVCLADGWYWRRVDAPKDGGVFYAGPFWSYVNVLENAGAKFPDC